MVSSNRISTCDGALSVLTAPGNPKNLFFFLMWRKDFVSHLRKQIKQAVNSLLDLLARGDQQLAAYSQTYLLASLIHTYYPLVLRLEFLNTYWHRNRITRDTTICMWNWINQNYTRRRRNKVDSRSAISHSKWLFEWLVWTILNHFLFWAWTQSPRIKMLCDRRGTIDYFLVFTYYILFSGALLHFRWRRMQIDWFAVVHWLIGWWSLWSAATH